MASIVKRKKKYSVVYTYTDENGNKRQKWETFETNAEAKKRKLQVEYEQESGTFIPPSAKTVNDLLDEYMSIYGVNTWAMSTYESRKSLIANYIRPLIGDMKLEDTRSPFLMSSRVCSYSAMYWSVISCVHSKEPSLVSAIACSSAIS